MKELKRFMLCAATALLCTVGAQAQYYQTINQATNMLSTALSGGLNYRGTVDASFTAGIGTNGCHSLEFSTSQGFKYADWFFMGVGAGVNVMFAGDNAENSPYPPSFILGNEDGHVYRTHDTGVMIPLFTDFRFYIGKQQDVSMYIGMKLGAAFLIGKEYLRTPDGYLDSSEGFYFKPTLGVRVPVSSKNAKYALNFGVSYQLLTNDYWDLSGYYSNTTVNSIGASVGFEW